MRSMRWALSSQKSSSALAFALGLVRPSVALEDAQLIVLLSASGSGQVSYEVRQTLAMKPQIAAIEPHLELL